MPTRPFRLLRPVEYAALSAQEKKDYLRSMMLDIRRHRHAFRADNRRVVDWLRSKDEP